MPQKKKTWTGSEGALASFSPLGRLQSSGQTKGGGVEEQTAAFSLPRINGRNETAAKMTAQDPTEVRAAAARGEATLPSYWEKTEQDFLTWAQAADDLAEQARKDSAARDGVWQDSTSFEDYRQQQTVSARRLQNQTRRYRDFFDSHRSYYGDEAVDSVLEALDRGGKSLTGIEDALSAESRYRGQFAGQEEFDTYNRLQSYEKLRDKADFAEKSRYVSTYRPGTEQYYTDAGQGFYVDTGYGDINYDYINRDQRARDRQTVNDLYTGMAIYGYDNSERREMTDDEIAIFNYLYAQDEAAGDMSHKSAYQYIEDLTSTLNARQREYQETLMRDFADKGKLVASAYSLLNAPGKALSYIGQIADYADDGKVDQNAGYNQYAYNNAAIRGQRSQAIGQTVSDAVTGLGGVFGSDWSGAGEKLGGAAGDLYQTGMSIGDSLINHAITGGIAGKAGVTSKAGQKLAEFAGLGILGAGAAADSVIEKKDMGYDDQRSFLLGTASGAIEALTEIFSLESLLDKTSMGRSSFGYLAKNFFAEGSEEGASDLLNWALDEAYDFFSGQSDSEWKRMVRAYMDAGMSREEAEKAAVQDRLKEFSKDFALGGLSGGLMAGGNLALNAVFDNVYNADAGIQASTAQQVDPLVQAAPSPQDVLKMLAEDTSFSVDGKPRQSWLAEMWELYGEDGMDTQTGGQWQTAQEMAYNPQSAPPAQTAPFEKGAEGQGDSLVQAAREMAETTIPRQAAPDTPFQKGAEGQGTDGAAEGNPKGQMGHLALQQAAEVFGENGRKAFAAAWDGQGDPARYYAGFAAWYQAGLEGKAENQVRSPYAGAVSEAQRLAAYNSGQRDGAVSLAKEKAAAPFAKTAGAEAGLVYDEYVAEAVESASVGRDAPIAPGNDRTHGPDEGIGPYTRTAENAPYITAETVERINTVAKALGARVRFVDSVDEGRANAQISGSEILVERNNPNPVMTIVGHELTHRVQELSPETYRAFREAAVAELADSAVQAKLAAYRAQGENILYEQAMDEAAADYAGRLMEETQVLDRFIERHRTDRTLLEKVRDAFRHLIDKLTGAEKRKAQTAEGKLSAALDAAAEGADSLSKAQSPVSAYGAATPFQKGAEGPGADGTVRYSLKQYSPEQIENWAGSKRIVVYEGQEHLQRFIQDALNGRNLNKKMYFGSIQADLAARIKADTGVDVEGYNCSISAYEVQKILANSHGSENSESQRGQRAITAADIETIPDIITSPDTIRLGDRLYNGRPVILFEKTVNGRTTVVSYASQKHMDLAVQTMYVGKNKKSLATPPGEVSPVPQTSETSSGTALDDSIPRSGGEVKRFSLKEAQLRAIQDSNPAEDDYHTWVRSVEDIKTFDEALSDPEWADYDEFDPDYSMEMARKAQKRGEITVYSSYPIQTGVFVTPSRMEAESYSGSSRVYSKTVKLDQVAWIDPTQGQFAPTSGDNSQYSLKGTTITRTYDQLLRENDALRERLDYWRGQTRTTKAVTTDRKSVTAAAKALVQEYGAKLDAGALAERLQGLYDAMASGKDGQNELGPTDAWQRAEAIARDLADTAVEEWSLSAEFPGLKDKLRTTPITIGHEYDGDIRNENFRREYRGRLKLSSQGTTNVDTVYAELAEAYPGLFPQDITHPADQLEQIMEVADSLSAVSEQNPFSGHMEEAVTGITNEIMEGFFDLPQTKTIADRQAEKLAQAKAHGQNRVAETREQYKARLDALRRENRQAVQNAIARERETRARQLQALKARYAQSRENAAGRRADSRARDRLLHIVRRLQNAKLPEVNRTLLNEYIGDLDTVAKSMTGKTLEKLESLWDWYREQKANNPDFIADPKIEKDLERLSKRQIGDLSAREVADLTQVLLHIENEIRTQRRLIDSQERRDVYQAGEAAIRDIEASAGSKPSGLWSFWTGTSSPRHCPPCGRCGASPATPRTAP